MQRKYLLRKKISGSNSRMKMYDGKDFAIVMEKVSDASKEKIIEAYPSFIIIDDAAVITGNNPELLFEDIHLKCPDFNLTDADKTSITKWFNSYFAKENNKEGRNKETKKEEVVDINEETKKTLSNSSSYPNRCIKTATDRFCKFLDVMNHTSYLKERMNSKDVYDVLEEYMDENLLSLLPKYCPVESNDEFVELAIRKIVHERDAISAYVISYLLGTIATATEMMKTDNTKDGKVLIIKKRQRSEYDEVDTYTFILCQYASSTEKTEQSLQIYNISDDLIDTYEIKKIETGPIEKIIQFIDDNPKIKINNIPDYIDIKCII